jgi:hypothetical protein
MHSEISKKKIFLDFLDRIYEKKKSLTPHTYIQGIVHPDRLCKVEPMASLKPRILFIIDELISQYWYHIVDHVNPIPHRNEFMNTNIISMSGFLSYGISLMGSIKA